GTEDRYGGLAVVLPAHLHPHADVNGVGVGVDLREQAEALVEVEVRDDVGGAGPEVRVPVPAHDRVRVHDAAAGRVAHLPAVGAARVEHHPAVPVGGVGEAVLAARPPELGGVGLGEHGQRTRGLSGHLSAPLQDDGGGGVAGAEQPAVAVGDRGPGAFDLRGGLPAQL